MSVSVSVVCCQEVACVMGRSFRWVLLSVLCLSVIVKPR